MSSESWVVFPMHHWLSLFVVKDDRNRQGKQNVRQRPVIGDTDDIYTIGLLLKAARF